jgi:type IV pilus assembly protein PilC
MLPLFGKVRKAFSLGRFCGTYEMQLQSGVNVMDSLKHAGKASQSAVLMGAVQRMLPKIRAGEQVGPAMAGTGAFPKKMIRAIRLGEETGKLDEELKQLTENFQREAMARIATLSEWIPKILYLVIAGYVGYQVISFYAGMMSDVTKQLE